MTPYDRLAALGLTLPQAASAAANYLPYLRHGSDLYIAGQGPFDATGKLRTGKVGRDLTVAQAYDDARVTGLNVLAQVHAATGDLGRVVQVVKVLVSRIRSSHHLPHP